jgi:iron complex outermembrane recepter protein
MSCNRYWRSCALGAAILASAVAASAQAEHPQTWAQDIAFMEKLAPAEAAAQQSTILQIRTEVAIWLGAHPQSGIQLSSLPTLPMGADQAAAQVQELRKVVAEIVAQDPSHPFHLGQTEVEVSATLSAMSTATESITQTEIQQHNAVNVTQAIDLLPGVEISRISGKRNETSFMIRGFSSKGQVPFYLDGIPIYVPYDGYIDLNRFLTSDIAEIQVARGFSSALLGPNALGGTVNLVTREPSKKFEGDMAMGTSSGNGLLSSLRVGSKHPRFLVQGNLDWLQADYIPLSGNFSYPTGGYTALNKSPNVAYPLTNHENQSYSRDEKFGGRIGWLPKNGGQYIFSYTNQKGQKGAPLYQGANAAATFNAFWKWPYWNRNSYYFLSDTGLGEKSSIKFRVYYDQFRNSIDMYDNSQYNSMKSYTAAKGYGSEISWYDEHTDGVSTEVNTRKVKHNVLGASFFFKDDTHNEDGIYPGAAALSTAAAYIPKKTLRDQQFSTGIQDLITFNARLHATVGFSADHIKGLIAQTYNSYNQDSTGTIHTSKTALYYANIYLLPYKCTDDPTNTSFSGCTAHFWNYNPQASVTYTVSDTNVLSVTYEDRGRFPTLKERYSSGMGSSLPSPELKTEHSQNWNFGYTHSFGAKLSAELTLFHSALRDAIESALVDDADGLCPSNSTTGKCSQYINIGKETHQGVELQVLANPISWFKLNTNYTYLNREVGVAELPTGTTLSSALVLPTGLPKNKLVGTGTFQFPYRVRGIVTARYEGGVTLQDTSYASTSALYQPYGESLATFDLAANIPVRAKFEAQTGVKNLIDRNYFYTAGYPEEGRNWFLNLRYRF